MRGSRISRTALIAAAVMALSLADAVAQAPDQGIGAPPPPDGGGELATFGALLKDGYEVRATSFVPADAVSRQSGKSSSDAIVLTLQKGAASAVCFYTLKAYVSEKLGTIPACTVHR